MLLVFGDSHSVIWGGRLDEERFEPSRFSTVKIHYLGPSLAYSLMGDNGEIGKWGAQILDALAAYEPDAVSAIMLCFGEIDVRTQVIKWAVMKGQTIDEASAEIVARYMQFIDLLRQKTNVPVFIWGPIPSAKDFADWGPSYPYIGCEAERNLATQSFHRQLDMQSKTRRDVYPFRVFGELTVDGLYTRNESFPDRRHFGFAALALGIDKLNKVIRDNNLALPIFFEPQIVHELTHNVPLLEISKSSGIASPATDKKAQIKDIADKVRIISAPDSPHAVVDIGYGTFIRRLVVDNQVDVSGNTKTLEIFVGVEMNALTPIYQSTIVSDAPVDIKLESAPPLRYIVFRLREKEILRLGKISIFAESFL